MVSFDYGFSLFFTGISPREADSPFFMLEAIETQESGNVSMISWYHSIMGFHYFLRESHRGKLIRHFSSKSMDTTTHELNVMNSKTKLDCITQEQTINCWRLFVGYMISCRSIKI